MDQYQEVQKPDDEGSGGVRRWKPILIRNYKKIWWTTEGGNIQALRNMLQMHVHSISLTVHALQRWVLPVLSAVVMRNETRPVSGVGGPSTLNYLRLMHE